MLESEIEKLLAKFDRSNLTEMEVKNGNNSIYLSKQKNGSQRKVTNVATPSVEASAPSTLELQKRPASSKNIATEDSKQQSKTTDQEHDVNNDQGYQVKAPMVGIVYFAPDPSKPDFKKIGDHVDKGETICVIEAMKINNEIKSPISGTITKRLVKNGAMVQYHQSIFDLKED